MLATHFAMPPRKKLPGPVEIPPDAPSASQVHSIAPRSLTAADMALSPAQSAKKKSIQKPVGKLRPSKTHQEAVRNDANKQDTQPQPSHYDDV